MSRRAWIAFAAMSLIWGVPYLFIKFAVRGGVPPLPLAFARVALAAVVLLTLAARAGTLRALRGHWRWLAAYGLAEVAAPFPLIAFGEERIPSSLAAIVIASVPLIGALLALRFDHSERPTRSRAMGMALGFAGVIALVGLDTGRGGGMLLGTLAVLVAAAGYATGPMIVKLRLAALDPRAAMGGSLAAAALAPGAVLTLPRRVPTAGALVSVGALGLICTAAAFVIFAVLIREAGSSRATVITYLNPVVALALGVAVLGERPDAGALAGLLLILAGSWLATGGGLPPRRRRSPTFADPTTFSEASGAVKGEGGQANDLEERMGMSGEVPVTLRVNGVERQIAVEPRRLLVHALREDLGLTGTHVGCDTSNCGACTVHLDGQAVKSCTVLAVQADGAEITTIEGLGTEQQLHPLQEAFWNDHALQCGFCTPGMIMAAAAFLAENPDPTEEQVRRALEGNLCRCTGYHNIVRAVLDAAKSKPATVGAAS